MGEIFEVLAKEEGYFEKRRRLNVVCTSSELKPANVSSRSFPFWFGT